MTMRCTGCGKPMTKILDTRQKRDGSVWRRRSCEGCGARFSSIEMPAARLKAISDAADQIIKLVKGETT